ncbi:hypothetical protein BURKHO8Y_580064 [Burkholderia sp. 8Y]|nr:hypothetical protein BURKHO8Y_580064 [Burkholderia sp. 8Y]
MQAQMLTAIGTVEQSTIRSPERAQKSLAGDIDLSSHTEHQAAWFWGTTASMGDRTATIKVNAEV